MASVYVKKVKNGEEIYVIQQYLNEDKEKAQKWHRFDTEEEANEYLPAIKKAERAGRIWHKPLYPTSNTIYYANRAEEPSMIVKELLMLYYKQQCADGYWRANTARGYRGLINHYIVPFIGEELVEDVTTYYIQLYYRDCNCSVPLKNPQS